MRFIVMLVTAVRVLFLIKLGWPKRKSIYDSTDDIIASKHRSLLLTKFTKTYIKILPVTLL